MSPAVITPLTDVSAPPVQPSRSALRATDTPLCRARVARGWSQRKVVRALRLLAESWGWEVAAESSLTVQISRWENGVNRPSQTYQVLLCALFRATPQDLGFTRTGNATLADRIDALEHLVSDLAAQLETAVAA
ncbi:XRE family transcriptional regulator [Streptomyces sp. NPDC093676]|uniref:XRE family transcriptional regulator n=1 Tax=Streptomyces sp. NPDC093676 TaxID=3366050 RepID=UPI003830FB95